MAAVARRRTRSPVTARAEVVAPLDRCGLALAEPLGTRAESPAEPVREGTRRASGSSTTSASERVPSGTPDQESGGERSIALPT